MLSKTPQWAICKIYAYTEGPLLNQNAAKQMATQERREKKQTKKPKQKTGKEITQSYITQTKHSNFSVGSQ